MSSIAIARADTIDCSSLDCGFYPSICICIMPHFPSLFVGTVFSGCAFLAIHQQLSHRRRLSEQWALQGTFFLCGC